MNNKTHNVDLCRKKRPTVLRIMYEYLLKYVQLNIVMKINLSNSHLQLPVKK